MLIAQISDTHISSPDPAEPIMAVRIQALETFVAHINALDEKPDLVIHTGDVTQGGEPAYYAIIKSIMGQLPMPVYFALGNRDKGQNLVEGLKDLGGASLADGFVIYSVEDFPVRLIAMDTQHRDSNIGTACSVRLAVLDKLLKAYPHTPTALFMHHPPFEVTTSKYPFQFDDQGLADAFLALVAEHKQVVHMFCGHAHRDFSVDLGTCVASVSPSLPPDNRLGDFGPGLDDQPLYQLHRWNPETMRFESSVHAAVLDLQSRAVQTN